MPTFVTRPIPVEARQHDGTPESANALADWMLDGKLPTPGSTGRGRSGATLVDPKDKPKPVRRRPERVEGNRQPISPGQRSNARTQMVDRNVDPGRGPSYAFLVAIPARPLLRVEPSDWVVRDAHDRVEILDEPTFRQLYVES